MIFKPELAEQVMAGRKTMTRRRFSENPRSPWSQGRCGLAVGCEVSVQPGRAKRAVGRVRVTSVAKERLGSISHEDARREGFLNREGFFAYWQHLYGDLDPFEEVWVVGFEPVTVADSLPPEGSVA